tara:strand:- start:3224 stop:3670 length:447 start_codon:yes stop_codon:yes gene_type:complete
MYELMRVIETKVYTIDEHPNKEKCFDWIRNNWHDLNQHSVDEVIDSLTALQKEIGGDLDYSISSVSDRGEFITLKDYDKEALFSLSADDCSLTGVCWDVDLIEGLKSGNTENVLHSLHSDTEHCYSDKGLFEMCEANEYEFSDSGEVI